MNNEANLFWTINTYEATKVPQFINDAYEKVLPYITDFLCSSHPFRNRITCPFVPSAIKKDRIFFTYSSNEVGSDRSQFIKSCINFYLHTKSSTRSFGALIILFQENHDLEDLLQIHLLNKEQCVENALMLGALYSTSQAHSLHSSSFFPLRTPTPVLVMRDMVIHDLTFLEPKHYNIKKRIKFLDSFIKIFQAHAVSSIEKEQVKEAIRIKRRYEIKLYRTTCLKVLGSAIGLLLTIIIVSKYLPTNL